MVCCPVVGGTVMSSFYRLSYLSAAREEVAAEHLTELRLAASSGYCVVPPVLMPA